MNDEKIVVPLKCDYFNELNIPFNIREKINQILIQYGWETFHLISKPFFLGLEKIETEISFFLPPKTQFPDNFYENDDISIFFNFLSIKGEILEWPQTFRIQLFGKWMGKVNGDHKLYHFLPKIILSFDVENKIPIQCEFTQPFFLIFQVSSKNNSVFNNIPQTLEPSPISFSPISGQRMLFPVRTLHCHHDQCIELNELITSLNIDGCCPLCHCHSSLSEIVLDITTQLGNIQLELPHL